MDGLTATQRIRQELQLRIPIIAMTAHAMQQDIDKSLEAGMDGHINKPVDPNRFFDVLVEILNKQQTSATTEVIDETLSEPTPLDYIDKHQAMQTLLNDEALYQSLLEDFAALNGELDVLRRAIDEKAYMTIVRVVHIYVTALKYIGAYALADLASSVERTINQNENHTTQAFDERLETLFTALVEMNARVEEVIS